MESKLLVGGKNIMDHTNEQQKMLETKRQEIAEQVPHCVCVTLSFLRRVFVFFSFSNPALQTILTTFQTQVQVI